MSHNWFIYVGEEESYLWEIISPKEFILWKVIILILDEGIWNFFFDDIQRGKSFVFFLNANSPEWNSY